MTITWIQILSKRNFPLVCLCAVFLVRPVAAENNLSPATSLIKNALSSVETTARRCKNLKTLGQNTIEETTLLLDIGPSHLSFLSNYLSAHKKDWRVQFWLVDLLGYIGNQATAVELTAVLANPNERTIVKKQALQSIEQIAKRNQLTETKIVIAKLQQCNNSLQKNTALKKAIQKTVEKLAAVSARKTERKETI